MDSSIRELLNNEASLLNVFLREHQGLDGDLIKSELPFVFGIDTLATCKRVGRSVLKIESFGNVLIADGFTSSFDFKRK